MDEFKYLYCSILFYIVKKNDRDGGVWAELYCKFFLILYQVHIAHAIHGFFGSFQSSLCAF